MSIKTMLLLMCFFTYWDDVYYENLYFCVGDSVLVLIFNLKNKKN
jgi:hypothetical protein